MTARSLSSMSFRFQRLELPDVVRIEPTRHVDARGALLELYKYSEFSAFGITEHFVQDNWSRSVQGVLRGLHYQTGPSGQSKLVCTTRGEIFDVAADVRPSSPTYRRWIGTRLSADLGTALYIPRGFAHGFCVLTDFADVMYKMTAEHSPQHQGGIIWNDPELGITWPLSEPILSQRDATLPLLRSADLNF